MICWFWQRVVQEKKDEIVACQTSESHKTMRKKAEIVDK